VCLSCDLCVGVSIAVWGRTSDNALMHFCDNLYGASVGSTHVLDRGFWELYKALIVMQRRLRIIIAARRKARQGQFNVSALKGTQTASRERMQIEHDGAHALTSRPALRRRMLASEVPRSLRVVRTAFALINITTRVRRFPAANGDEPDDDGFVTAAREAQLSMLYPSDQAKEERIAVLAGHMAERSAYPADVAKLNIRQLSLFLASTTCAADTRRCVPGGDGRQLRLTAEEVKRLFLATEETVAAEKAVDPVHEFAKWQQIKCLDGVADLLSGTNWHEMMYVG
jgi:hypothetical protein